MQLFEDLRALRASFIEMTISFVQLCLVLFNFSFFCLVLASAQESTKPQGVCSGIWLQDVSKRTLGAGLGSGKFGAGSAVLGFFCPAHGVLWCTGVQ